MNKSAKTLGILAAVLAVGAALSTFAQQAAFADVSSSSAAGNGPAGAATSAGASSFGATSCGVASPFPVESRGGLEERTQCFSG